MDCVISIIASITLSHNITTTIIGLSQNEHHTPDPPTSWRPNSTRLGSDSCKGPTIGHKSLRRQCSHSYISQSYFSSTHHFSLLDSSRTTLWEPGPGSKSPALSRLIYTDLFSHLHISWVCALPNTYLPKSPEGLYSHNASEITKTPRQRQKPEVRTLSPTIESPLC